MNKIHTVTLKLQSFCLRLITFVIKARERQPDYMGLTVE